MVPTDAARWRSMFSRAGGQCGVIEVLLGTISTCQKKDYKNDPPSPPTPAQKKHHVNSGVPARSSDLVGPGFGPDLPRSASGGKYQPRRPILARFRTPAEKSKSQVIANSSKVSIKFETHVENIYNRSTKHVHSFIRSHSFPIKNASLSFLYF